MPTWQPITPCSRSSSRAPVGRRGHIVVREARIARGEPRVSREQVSLLGWTYELKNAADYEQEHAISTADAERAISEAAQLIDTIAALIGSTAT